MSGPVVTNTRAEACRALTVATHERGWIVGRIGNELTGYRPEDRHARGAEIDIDERGEVHVDIVESAAFGIAGVVVPRAVLVALIRDAIARGVITAEEITKP